MDSKQEKAKLIGNEEQLREHLGALLMCKDKELFIVVKKDAEQMSSWKYGNDA